jgi:hypothetical protein
VALYLCVRTGVHHNATQGLGALIPRATTSKSFLALKESEKKGGGVGEVAKKLKGNFGVAFAFQSSKSSSQSPF